MKKKDEKFVRVCCGENIIFETQPIKDDWDLQKILDIFSVLNYDIKVIKRTVIEEEVI